MVKNVNIVMSDKILSRAHMLLKFNVIKKETVQ